jgi:cell wall-associated NlpC family hydrolase
MKTINISKPVLVDFMYQCLNRVKYKMGAKARLGDTPMKDFVYIDCSGFVRWLLHIASGVRMPDGSYNQRKWCEQQGFAVNPYRKVAGLKDNRLRIAFIDASKGKAGHVWLIVNGKTIESYGGHGVGRRRWNSLGLYLKAKYCFTLTDVMAN